VREGEDPPPHQPPAPPAPQGFTDAFNKSFQVSFVATSFVLIAFAALWVRIARRLRRDRERDRNIIEAEYTTAEPDPTPPDPRLR